MSASAPVVLVTGAARRIGAAIARRMHADGYAVALHCNRSREDADALAAEFDAQRPGSAWVLQGDLADAAVLPKLVADTVAQFGRLDALVNCAAAWKSKRLEDVTAGDLRHFFETNTLGTFLCAQQAGLAMVRQAEGGCIVNLGDWAVARPYLNYAAYFPSKGAIPTLTRCLAVELGSRNPSVRVNCILPGLIDTALTRYPERWSHVIGETEDNPPKNPTEAETWNNRAPRVPLHVAWLKPEDVSPMAVFLASDASAMCSGANFEVTGGDSAQDV